MANCDLVLIQEHWLLNYEGNLISDRFTDHLFAVKCTDDNSPDLPMFRRRETGGTAAIWKKDIDQHIEILPDGSDRIMALIIKSGEHDILAINSYMLTLGCSDRVWRNTK